MSGNIKKRDVGGNFCTTTSPVTCMKMRDVRWISKKARHAIEKRVVR